VRDPHHLPRWWPRVERVEDVLEVVRSDFDLVSTDEQGHALTWSQRVQGTPFGRVLRSSETQVSIEPACDPQSTDVTIELRQVLNGFFPRFGGHMVRRAARATLDEALDGLERISG
jgi:hypothetical protein